TVPLLSDDEFVHTHLSTYTKDSVDDDMNQSFPKVVLIRASSSSKVQYGSNNKSTGDGKILSHANSLHSDHLIKHSIEIVLDDSMHSTLLSLSSSQLRLALENLISSYPHKIWFRTREYLPVIIYDNHEHHFHALQLYTLLRQEVFASQ